MEVLMEIYGDPTFGTMSIIATIVAWVIGILFILEGKQRKDREPVEAGLGIIFFGSIPYLNAFALGVLLIFGGVAVLVLTLNVIGKFISSKIVGK